MLVVDDNAAAREVAARMVRTLGWSADLVDSGEAALAALQDPTRHYDSVFVDWQMPELDGWQTARRIRQLPGMGRAPTIVMVTAHGRDILSTRPADEQQLIDGFLVKPVTASMLYDAIVDAGSAPGDKLRPVRSSPSAAPRLSGMRLLVAEDNANNQQVARELLEDEGAAVVIAGNGLEALEAVAAADPPFDAVLMDLQMPVMDGYSATSRIRQALGQQSLPIIAMTANAMASDREACLAAGMNEHVGKPFDLDHLVAVLRRLGGRQALASAQADVAVTPDTAALQAAAAAGVGIEAALRRLGGNRKVYARTLRGFVDDLGPISTQLLSAAQRADWPEAARTLHTLRGVAGTVGATALAECAGTAEAALLAAAAPARGGAAEPDRAAAVRGFVDRVAAASPALLVLCRALDAGGAAASGRLPDSGVPLSAADVDALTAGLATVARLLADSDLEAIEALRALRQQVPGAAGARFDSLEEAAESLDFDAALAHCNGWLEECAS